MYSKIRFIKVIPYDVLLMNHLFSFFGDVYGVFFPTQPLNNVILEVLPLDDKTQWCFVLLFRSCFCP